MRDRTKKLDRFFHLKFPSYAFMAEFANFVPSTTKIPHYDAQFKMYGGWEDKYGESYGAKFTLEGLGDGKVHELQPQRSEDGVVKFIENEGDTTFVVVKKFGTVPDERQFKWNEEKDKSEYIDALALLDDDQVTALDEFERVKLENIDIVYVRDLQWQFLTSAKVGAREDGTWGYIGWTPWYNALSAILAAHPVERVTVPVYITSPGRTIKGAEVELHVGGEVYRTANFYWHGSPTAEDVRLHPEWRGDYGGFTQCRKEENYSFAMFHFEVVKPGIPRDESE